MRKQLLFVAGVALVAVTGFFGYASLSGTAQAADCSANAVITCGVTSVDQLRNKYNTDTPKGTQTIFNHFGITSDIVNTATNKVGYVTKSGDVVVDGKVVASGAVSAGRQNMPGSTAHTINGTTFYTRSTQSSFVSNTISAIVFFDAQGRFSGAVLHDCGNPVMATNKVVAQQTPVYTCDTLKATKVSRTTYTLQTGATASNGAAIKDYVYSFGDGQTATAGASVNHTYAKPGTYTATVTVRVSVDGQVVNAPGANCKVTIVVEPEMCPIPGKEQYPKDDPRCLEDKPSVEVTKTVNKQKHAKVKLGDTFTYEIVVKNTGNIALKNVVLTDKAPAEVSLIGSSDVGTIKNDTWTYTLPELAVGASKTFTLTAKYTKFTAGTHKNTVCVDTPTVPGTPDDCDDATTETLEYITVCDLTDNTIKTILRSEFDESHMTLEQTKCGDMRVCVIETKTEKTIAKKDFDSKTMTTDFSQCVVPPAVVELPKTGLGDSLGSMLGVGSVVGTSYAFVASRRSIR